MTSGIGGHPDTLMMGLSPTIAVTGHAPVGLGSAKGIPPKAEHVPTHTMAAAPLAASRSVSTALRPPAVQYAPPAPVGTDSSTSSTYFPKLSFMALSRADSAASPAAAIRVSS